MPVIVVGADTPLGTAIVEELTRRGGEVRAFVGDREAAATMSAAGLKVAVGDLSDATHVSAASLGAFCAVLVEEAAGDGRELGFARDVGGVFSAWAQALAAAGITRVVWVGDEGATRPSGAPEEVTVATAGAAPAAIAARVADLNDRARL